MRREGSPIVYGSSTEQWYEWYEPQTEMRAKGVVVLVHGGFWRQEHTLVQMHPLVDFFLKHGWAVANLEYRRGGCGGDWPFIKDDVNHAFESIRLLAQEKDIVGPVVGIGHSVGGQLVLLAAAHQDLVIALAPVTDVARTAQEDLGESAAVVFFGEALSHVSAEASPLHQLPVKESVWVIHGVADQRVPLAHSEDFVAAMERAGTTVQFLTVPDLDHFYIIDPSCSIWSKVIVELASMQK